MTTAIPLGVCVAADLDTDLLNLKEMYLNKFSTFTKLLGDDCSIIGTFSNLMKDASNLAHEWEKGMKKAIADIIKVASEIYKGLDSMTGGLLSDAVDMIKSTLSAINDAFTAVMDTVKDMMGAIKEAADGIKMAMCDTISTSIALIPDAVVSASAAASMIKNYNFAKDQSTGRNIVGKYDVDVISTNIMRNLGAEGMKNQILTAAVSIASKKLPNLADYRCTVVPV